MPVEGIGPPPSGSEVGLEGLVPYEEALALVVKEASALRPAGDDELPLEKALGAVLAEDVVAPAAMPPAARAAMDGYAVRSEDVRAASSSHPVPLALTGTVTAGQRALVPVAPGTCVRIMTGVPLPEGADAVVPQELVRSDGRSVWVGAAVAPGAYTVPAGEDAAAGETVLATGSLLSPGRLALLAALGRTRVRVRRPPRMGILVTGDEVVPAEASAVGPGQVRDSNAHGIMGQLLQWGARAQLWGIAPDDEVRLAGRAREMAEQCDGLVITGGMSVGLRDLVRPVLEKLGVRWLVHRVAIRPGRPFAFGLWDGKPVFGLPGTPAGAMVAAELFIRPLVAIWLGQRWEPPEHPATLTRVLRMTPGRLRLVRARARLSPEGYEAEPLARQSSSSVRSMADANCLIMVPADVEALEAGARVRIRLL